jgi:hypothetical protein
MTTGKPLSYQGMIHSLFAADALQVIGMELKHFRWNFLFPQAQNFTGSFPDSWFR